jgi:AAA domain, putative AbiEii toxin, Type IV TA system
LSNENQPRLLSFTLDGWDVLGGKVSVSLSDRVAVLVGQNGAGKSAILEGFEAIAARAGNRYVSISEAVPQKQVSSMPKVLDVEILTPDNRRLNYHYEIITLLDEEDALDLNPGYSTDGLKDNQLSWNDYCQYTDEQQEILWSTEGGLTTLLEGENSIILGNKNPFEHYRHISKSTRLPTEMQWVSNTLQGVDFIGEKLTNQSSERHISKVEAIGGTTIFPHSTADKLSLKIVNIERKNELNEIESICQRIGIASEITVQEFVLNASARKESEERISLVSLDKINIGLLSDGTLRILSILIEIITAPPFSTIIIEEPEIRIHPGMLTKLLNEIEAYTFDQNLIISTHSPQVVSRTEPNKINLVYRNNSRTVVRKLGKDEIHRVTEYLNEEGDLGEWLYSGILDE